MDFTGSCIPDYDKEPYSQTLRAIETLIKLQHREQRSFELFLTFKAQRSRDNKQAIKELRELLGENLSAVDVKQIFLDNFDSIDNLEKSYHNFLLVTIPKLITSMVYEETTNYELIIHPYHIYKNSGRTNGFYLVNITLTLHYISRMRKRKGIRRAQGIQNEDYKSRVVSILQNEIVNIDRILSDSTKRQQYDSFLNDSLNLPFGD